MSGIFLNPWWFALLPFIGAALFLIYRNKGSQQQRRVSSVTLLTEFQKTPHAKALPFVPLRFLLEVLFALTVIIALSRVTQSTESKNVLIVVDTSLSTQRKTANGTLISQILKNQLEEYLYQFSDEQLFTLVVADGSSVEQNVTAQDILSRIEEQRTPYADTLESIVKSTDFSRFDEVFLMTEREVKQAYTQKFIFPKLPQLPLNNLFLTSVTTQANPGKTVIQGTLGKSVKYDHQPASVQVLVEDEQGKPLGATTVMLLNDDNSFKLSVSQEKILSVQIKSNSSLQDSIAEDSKIFIKDEDAGRKVLIQDADIKKLNLPSLNSLHYYTADQFDSLKEESIGAISFSTISSENFKLLPGNILSHQFGKTTIQTAAVTEWNSESPLLTYIAFDRERIFSYSVVDCPSWMVTDLKIGQSAVLCHGINAGKRIVYSGIKLFPFDERQATVGNIVALNILKWLFENENFKEDVLLEESKLQQGPLMIPTVPSNVVKNEAAVRETFIPYKWFTIILALLLLADSYWWIKRRKVFGR